MKNGLFIFLASPILSIFSPSLYRSIPKSSLVRGFGYLAYIALIGGVLVTAVVTMYWAPKMDEFVNWFSYELPALTFENGQITTVVQEPYYVTHPIFGTLVTINTKKKNPKTEDIRDSFFYIASTVIYASDPIRNETRMFDLAAKAGQANVPPGPQTLTGELIRKVYQQVKPLFLTALFFAVWAVLFFWKLGVALLFSLFALLLNLCREDKFSYGTLLHFSIYAITVVYMLQLANLLMPNVSLTLPLWLGIIITAYYVVFGVLIMSPPERTRSIS